ncbi:MAG TPA: hypothetical protein GXX55_11565 [Firmicutes bacterium]|nr:hypothetical protein [Bacillota bacterium]
MMGIGRGVRFVVTLLGLTAFAVVISAAGTFGADPTPQYLWTMETMGEVFTYTNDNTGAKFKLSSEYVIEGKHSVAVIPSGSAIETKLAIPLEGEKLAAWVGNDTVVLNVYLPPENKLNPRMFFLGMANVTSGWSWVEGVFSKTEVKPGWNEVRFTLAEPMQKVDAGGRYILYFAFAGFDANNNKVPLTEPFYLDGIRVEKAVQP